MEIQNKFHFLFVMLGFMVLPTLAHATVTCEPKPMGTVDIKWGSDPIEYDFSKSQSQMDRMENDTENPYDRNLKTHVGGLMKGGITVQSRVQVATLTYPRTRQVCQWIDNMQVSININPKILISRDHKKGTCKHNAILEHEMKHVFVDREIVKKYIPDFKSHLDLALRKVGIVGPKDDRDTKKFQQKINGYMESQLKIIIDEMYDERSARQQKVDTLEEYERVAAKCR